MYTATYDPADDKLRLSAATRLDAETYARVKAAGFGWAPKQGVFYAVWSPSREDLLLELAGEIGDEDTTLVDRAEQRAERFEGYSESRRDDAERARDHVASIADGIPMGQPILVGHHSERHARKDAEKIENGMRRAVKMWETSQYWQSRAAGAIHAAKYKELAAVRARRIKGIEADKRSMERDIAQAEKFTQLWAASLAWDPEVRRLTREQARQIANYDHVRSGMCFPLGKFPRNPPASQYEGAMDLWSALGDTDEQAIITPEQARDFALKGHANTIKHATRWLRHISNRLEYERAMLAEGGGLAADRFDIQAGGRVQRRGQWFIVAKINRRDGAILSVTVLGHWCSTIPIEEVQAYEPPAEGDAEKVATVTKLAPLCNYPGDGFRHVLKANLKKTYSTWIHTFPATATHGAYRSYSTFKGGGGLDCHDRVGIFITDQKRKDPPALTVKPEPITFDKPAPAEHVSAYRAPGPNDFDAMRQSLRAGVQVVSAPQLFPTPAELAARMVQEADIQSGQCVLEPSAGTGNLVRAVLDRVDTEVLAYEINSALCSQLGRTFPSYKLAVRNADFLDVTDFMGCYPRILMNPPFEKGADIKHIQHAVKFLAPGGRLVAICANGPRQREQLMPLAEQSGGFWEDLPAGSFEQSGTGVNTALLVIEGRAAEREASEVR